MDKALMTPAGKKALEDELQQLLGVERPKVIQAIAEARAHGDLKENAEYAAARERQGFVEGRIAEINTRLAGAQVVDVSTLVGSPNVMFGATVVVFDADKDEKITYQIVGVDEADPKQGKLSYLSPIAKALIGKKVGDSVTIKVPKGEYNYDIERVEY